MSTTSTIVDVGLPPLPHTGNTLAIAGVAIALIIAGIAVRRRTRRYTIRHTLGPHPWIVVDRDTGAIIDHLSNKAAARHRAAVANKGWGPL